MSDLLFKWEPRRRFGREAVIGFSRLSVVFVFYCWITDFPQIQWQHTFIISRVHWGSGEPGLWPRISPGWNQGVSHGSSLAWGSGFFSRLTGCWQDSVPCSYRSKVPIFLLAVSWGVLSAHQCYYHILATWSSPEAVHDMVVCSFKASRRNLPVFESLFSQLQLSSMT